MAEKPKTYPQQIQELKAQLSAAQEEKNKALEQIQLLPELNEELQELREKLQEISSGDQTSFAASKARETDLQQQIDSNAQLARRYATDNQNLKSVIEQLESQLDLLDKERFKNIDLQKKIDILDDTIKSQNTAIATLNQRTRDIATEKDSVIEQQSKELQMLRMHVAGQNRVLNELRSSIASAPDTLALLKQIAGLPNGKSTE